MISIESLLNSKLSYRGSFLDGQWKLPARPHGSWDVVSPANVDWVLPPITYAFDDINSSVIAARKAFKAWSSLGLHQRVQAIQRFGEQLKKRSELLSHVISLETGKPLSEAVAETLLLQNRIQVMIEYGLPLAKSQVIDLGPEGKGEIHWRPKGVLAVIGPFNQPVHLPHSYIVPALLGGNVVIFKPSEKAPYSGQIYAEAAEAADLPPGVFQLIQGHGETGSRLVRDTGLDGVIATCSNDVGVSIQRELREVPERLVALQMGGKNAALVWTGANLENTAQDLIKSAFLTTGQRCTALSRVYVHPTLLHPLMERVHALAKELVISHPFDEDPAPFMGPLISSVAQERFLRYSAMSESEKSESIMRPKSLRGVARKNRKPLPAGFYVSPSINLVKKWDPKSSYQNHEIFGPDIFFCAVDSLEEGTAAVNSSGYGMAFSFFGGTEESFRQVADNVNVGLVYWNRPTVGASARLPFGGWGKSGNHRPMGLYALFATMQVQSRIHT